MEQTSKSPRITRRGMLHVGSATLAGVAALTSANAEDTRASSRDKSDRNVAERSPDHHLPNEREPGPNNIALEAENPN